MCIFPGCIEPSSSQLVGIIDEIGSTALYLLKQAEKLTLVVPNLIRYLLVGSLSRLFCDRPVEQYLFSQYLMN